MKPFTNSTFIAEDIQLLTAFSIEALILFGSQAQNTASKLSDYDIGVLIQPGKKYSHKHVYDAMYDLLSEKINQLVDIDIVFLRDAPLELQHHVAKYGIPLYEQTVYSFARFRESVMLTYADFAPLRKIFQAATFARIPS